MPNPLTEQLKGIRAASRAHASTPSFAFVTLIIFRSSLCTSYRYTHHAGALDDNREVAMKRTYSEVQLMASAVHPS